MTLVCGGTVNDPVDFYIPYCIVRTIFKLRIGSLFGRTSISSITTEVTFFSESAESAFTDFIILPWSVVKEEEILCYRRYMFGVCETFSMFMLLIRSKVLIGIEFIYLFRQISHHKFCHPAFWFVDPLQFVWNDIWKYNVYRISNNLDNCLEDKLLVKKTIWSNNYLTNWDKIGWSKTQS